VSSVPLNVPAITSVTPSTANAGALVVNFTGSSNAPNNQNYVVTACTDSQMTLGCRSASNFVSGNEIGGLTQGTAYYLQVEAAASPGWIAATSPTFGPTGASSQLNAPTGVTLGYGPTAGSLSVSFTGSSNSPGGVTYSATACTNAAMTAACVTDPIVSGGQISV